MIQITYTAPNGGADAYMKAVQKRILTGLREGVATSIEDLSYAIADKLTGNPVQSHSGELLRLVLNGVRVSENQNFVTGKIVPKDSASNLAQWVEEGFTVPGITKKIAFFSEAIQGLKVAMGHQKFTVAPHPYMNPTLIEQEPVIFATIREKVNDALAG